MGVKISAFPLTWHIVIQQLVATAQAVIGLHRIWKKTSWTFLIVALKKLESSQSPHTSAKAIDSTQLVRRN